MVKAEMVIVRKVVVVMMLKTRMEMVEEDVKMGV